MSRIESSKIFIISEGWDGVDVQLIHHVEKGFKHYSHKRELMCRAYPQIEINQLLKLEPDITRWFRRKCSMIMNSSAYFNNSEVTLHIETLKV